MVSYLTRSELLSMSSNLAESRVRVEKAHSRSANGNTFLSHSSKDDELMPVVVTILENHGATVYLDKKDEGLNNKPVKEIATHLRNTISVSKKFVLFASDNIKGSRWVPWELGLADGYKKPSNVVLFPALENAGEQAWTEQEYLGVYNRIVWGKHVKYEKEIWMVWDQLENTGTELSVWLKQ